MKKIIKKYTKKTQKALHKHIKKNKKLRKWIQQPEHLVWLFFGLLWIILIIKIINVQVIQHNHYSTTINKLHYQKSLLKAKRGDIFVNDKWGNHIQVTKNITLYDLYIEPQYFQPRDKDGKAIDNISAEENKQKFIELIVPFFYDHLCSQFGVLNINHEQCVKNIEIFSNKEILPKKPEFFYTWSWSILDTSGNDATQAHAEYSRTWYQSTYQKALNSITQDSAYQIIKNTLDKKITIWTKQFNYIGFFTDEDLLQTLETLPYIKIYENYAYIIPTKITNIKNAQKEIKNILTTYEKTSFIEHTMQQFTQQENKYVKLLSRVHPDIANKIIAIKKEYASRFYQCQPTPMTKLLKKQETLTKEKEDKNTTKKRSQAIKKELDRVEEIIKTCKKREPLQGKNIRVPFLHGLWLESYDVRYYPYGSFLSHTLWFVNSTWQPLYGVEEYMHKTLQWQNGKIIGRSSNMIGSIGANDFEVEKAKNGNDIYLTIDQNIQKYVEEILPKYQSFYRADAISVVVMNPHTWQVKAISNTPTFNSNNINSAFRYKPLDPEQRKIADHEEYIDTHLFVKNEDGTMRKATTSERSDPTVLKRIAENTYGSEAFVDKTIKYAYEPGSVFKPLTVAIGIDTDEITFKDYYNDKGESIITDHKGNVLYTIKNVSSKCLGENTYLNALTFSCNVGMIDIIQKIGRPIFYNYLEKLGFGSKTNIEIAWEESGFIEKANTTSLSRFVNNAFGLGMRVTPIQLAQWFSTLVNGWNLMKTTIIEKIYNKQTQEYEENKPLIIRKVFKKETANAVKNALFDIVEWNPETKKEVHLEWFTLWGKTGTAEIAYKGKYRGTEWRTNASFIGVVTKDNPQYVVVVQVRRPKTNKRWTYTAWPLFKDIAWFLIAYDLIQE